MARNVDINLVFEKINKRVNNAIGEILGIDVSSRYKDLIKYQVALGGKRIRPVLASISSRLLGGKTNNTVYAAAGLEIIHNYSLIIDDIIDNSPLRRGSPTVWKKFGTSIAQCVAIDYSAAILQAANRSVEPKKIGELF